MTVAEPTPPTPPTPNPTLPQALRPDLRLVPSPAGELVVAGELAEDPAETDPAEPVTQDSGLPEVMPLVPLDVRLLEALGTALRSRPRWTERPPSFSESWNYAMTGDWTTEAKAATRVAHGLVVLVAFTVTYPLEWLLRVRTSPAAFVLTVAMLVIAWEVL